MDRAATRIIQLYEMHSARNSLVGQGWYRAHRLLKVLVMGGAVMAPSGALAQSGNGSIAASFGGAALGAVSGSILTLSGGLVGCNRTFYPSRCSRITAAAGAVIGLTAGAVIGWNDRSGLDSRLESAGFGALLGAAGGMVLKAGLQHYDWPDVAASSAVGLTLGASIKGASIGLGVGAATGLLLWRFHPSFGPGGAVAVGLAAMALGGLTDWVADAIKGGTDTGGIPVQFSIPW